MARGTRKAKQEQPTGWQSRIVGEGEEAPDQILANPRNWRIHPAQQQEALGAMLDRVGWVQRIVVNRRTGHLVDGHLRVTLALRRDEPKVPVVYVDLSPEEEDLVLATLDPLGGLAVMDREQIQALTCDIEKDAQVEGLLSTLGFDFLEQTPGGAPPGDAGSDANPADTKLVLGEYRIEVPWADYLAWQEKLRAEVGFESEVALGEIRRRLRL